MKPRKALSSSDFISFTLLAISFFAINYSSITFVSSECTHGFFDCQNDKCISKLFVCDDDDDCGNFQDEMHCIDEPITHASEAASTNDSSINPLATIFETIFSLPKQTCPAEHFSCNDDFDTCLPQRWVCDGLVECSNGADERNCTTATVDCGDDFRCTKTLQCIPSIWKCDGIFDCEDNSDEKNCTTILENEETKATCNKEHGLFQCSTGECIGYSKVCDSKPDCLHGDDEGLICHVKHCNDRKCSHLCMYDDLNNTTRCYCPPGYRLLNGPNDTICSDYDECQDNKLTNFCTQKCINTEGSYRCDCFDHYEMISSTTSSPFNVSNVKVLHQTPPTCRVKQTEEAPIIYFSTGREIRAYNLRTHEYFPVTKATNGEVLIGVDWFAAEKKMIYFSSVENLHGSVYSSPIFTDNSTNLLDSLGGSVSQMSNQMLFHEDLKGIEGIAVDWLGEHFYITESAAGSIIVCRIDSAICTTLHSNLRSPRGITVRPNYAQLFWTEWGGVSPGIYQSNMDGSNVFRLIDNVEWPNDLTIDELTNRLYWCDGRAGTIDYYDFDIKHRHTVFRDQNRQPYSLSVFEDDLYWSDWSTNSIETCNKITGHQLRPLMMKADDRFFGISVYHPLKQQQKVESKSNPCEYSPCSHLCLLKPYGVDSADSASATVGNSTSTIISSLTATLSFSCHCPDHMILSNDQHSCIVRDDQPFVLVSTGSRIWKHYVDSLTTSHVEQVPLIPIYHISEIAYNYDLEELFLHDTFRNRIGLVDLKQRTSTRQWKTVVNSGLRAVMGMVYDVHTDALYWIDMIKGTLEVTSVNIARSARTIDSRRSWTSYSSLPPLIATLNDQLTKPVSLAISPSNRKIYIGLRSSPSQIVSLNMDGTGMQTLLLSVTGFPLTLTIDTSLNYLLWGDPILQVIETISLNSSLLNQTTINKPQKLISNDINTINSLAYNNGTIYWTNVESPAFYYSDLPSIISSTNVSSKFNETIYRKRITDISGLNLDLLKLVVASKQKPLFDFCQTGKHNCSHLCLVSTTGAICRCFDGFTSTDGGLTCKRSPVVASPSLISPLSSPIKPFIKPSSFSGSSAFEDMFNPEQFFQMISNSWKPLQSFPSKASNNGNDPNNNWVKVISSKNGNTNNGLNPKTTIITANDNGAGVEDNDDDEVKIPFDAVNSNITEQATTTGSSSPVRTFFTHLLMTLWKLFQLLLLLAIGLFLYFLWKKETFREQVFTQTNQRFILPITLFVRSKTNGKMRFVRNSNYEPHLNALVDNSFDSTEITTSTPPKCTPPPITLSSCESTQVNSQVDDTLIYHHWT